MASSNTIFASSEDERFEGRSSPCDNGFTMKQPPLRPVEWNSWLLKYQLGLFNGEDVPDSMSTMRSPSQYPGSSLSDMMVRDNSGKLVSSLDFFVKEGYLASPPELSKHRRMRDLALLRHNLDKSFGSKVLDSHCRQTKALFRAQFSAISLAQVDPNFMQVMGADGCGLEDIVNEPLPRSASLCSHAFLLGDRCAIIPNRSKDWRLKKFKFGPHPDYPQQPPLGFNFYASAPLFLSAPSSDFHDDLTRKEDVKVQVGRLCVLDFDAREDFGEAEAAQLEAMAKMAADSLHREWENRRTRKLMQMQTYTNQLTAEFHSKFLRSDGHDDEDQAEEKMSEDLQALFQLSCRQLRDQSGASGVVFFGPPFGHEKEDIISERRESTATAVRPSIFAPASTRRKSSVKEDPLLDVETRDLTSMLHQSTIGNDKLRRNSLLRQGLLQGLEGGMVTRRAARARVGIRASEGESKHLSDPLTDEQQDAIENWLDRYADPTRTLQMKSVEYRSQRLRQEHANRYQDDEFDPRAAEADALACLLPKDTCNFILTPVMTLDKQQASYAILIYWQKETIFEDWDRNFLLSSVSILQSAWIRRSAVQSDNARVKFMRLVSHELRTPLHGIIGMSSQLQHCLDAEGSQSSQNGGSHSHAMSRRDSRPGGTSSGEAIWLSKSIQYAGEDLRKMLDDMLECGRISVGMQHERSPGGATDEEDTLLVQIIETICQKQLVEYLTRQLHSEILQGPNASSTLPLVMVKLDKQARAITLRAHIDKVKKALTQFISNAVRFSKPPSSSYDDELPVFEITIGPVQETGGQDTRRREKKARARIVIKDNGIGMSESFVQHFAEPFRKADVFHQGAGIGAAVGTSTLHEVGGSVDVSSTLGVGTTITMVIEGDVDRDAERNEEEEEETAARRKELVCRVLPGLHPVRHSTVIKYLTEQLSERRVRLDETQAEQTALSFFLWEPMNDASTEALRQHCVGSSATQRMIVFAALLETEMEEALSAACIEDSAWVFFLASPWTPSKVDSLDVFLDQLRHDVAARSTEPSGLSAFWSANTESLFSPVWREEVPVMSPVREEEENIAPSPPPKPPSPTRDILPVQKARARTTARVSTRRPGSAPHAISDVDRNPLSPRIAMPPLRNIGPHHQAPADASRGFSVLLVEDNPINMRLLEACVKKVKCTYMKAFDGVEAVEKYKEMSPWGPSVVLLDISLPLMDGLEACKQMRAYSEKMATNAVAINPHAMDKIEMRSCLVVAITALSSEQDVQRGIESGVDEWRVKPANLPKLTSDLRAWQAKWQEEHQLSSMV